MVGAGVTPASAPFAAQKNSAQTIFPWVQALRALSALAVAFYHVGHDAIGNGGDPRGLIRAVINFMPWQASVDVFFVISGFVIVHSSGALFDRPGAPGIFLRRRLTRIIPLYWIMTTAFIGVLLLNRAQIHGDIGGPLYLLASYLFIPVARPDGLVQPAFGLGWTLNYEMFFYAIITPCLAFSRARAVAAVITFCALLVACARIFGFTNTQLHFWSNSIILDFLAGMLLAQALAADIRLSALVRYALVAVAIIELHLTRNAPPLYRPLVFGIPALTFVGAACLGNTRTRPGRLAALLIFMGDASYAMYLVHPFIMRGFSILWHRFHGQNEIAGLIYVLAGLTVAEGCAAILHVYVERNLYRMLRRRVGVTKNEAV